MNFNVTHQTSRAYRDSIIVELMESEHFLYTYKQIYYMLQTLRDQWSMSKGLIKDLPNITNTVF